jgi:hypothetical protein
MIYTDTILNKLSELSQMKTGRKLDAATSAFVTRELTQVLKEVLEVKYPELKGRKFVPVNSEVQKGAEFYTQKVFDGKGMAKIVSSKDTQLPNLALVADEIVRKVEEVAGFYDYSVRELEAAAFAGVSLSSQKAKNARRLLETTIDKLIMVGEAGKFTGFVNDPNVPMIYFDVPLEAANGDDVLEALHLWRNSVNEQSGGVFTANRIVFSQYMFNKLSSKSYSSVVPDSVLKLFAQDTGVDIDYSVYFNESNDGYSGAGYDTGIAYVASDECVSFANPIPFEELPPQEIDLGFKIPVRATFGAVSWVQPLSACYAAFAKV